MFPPLKIRVSGLEPKSYYAFCLQIEPFDDKRYRYVYHRYAVGKSDHDASMISRFFQLEMDGGRSRRSFALG